MRINPNKLEVKYALDIYKEIPGFPSHRDLTYILIRTLEDIHMLEQEFVAENIWVGMKTCMGTLADCRGFLEQVSSSENNTEEVLLEKVNTSKKGSSYRLIRNPWM
jgi:hypothetical protein